MPIYEYQCKKCEKIFEELQGFNDKPLKKCSECGGKVERMISLSAFHLKGSGWYETDYGKKKTLTTVNGNQKSDENNNKNNAEDNTQSQNTAEQTHENIKKDTQKAQQKSKD